MVSSLLLFMLAQGKPSAIASIENPDLRISAHQSRGWRLEFQAKRDDGRVVTVATSDQSIPWKDARVSGRSMLLYADGIVAQVAVPVSGKVATITVTALPNVSLKAPRLGLVLTPNGTPIQKAAVLFPSPRTLVATEDQFSCPIAMVSGGGVALAIMPMTSHLETFGGTVPALSLDDSGPVTLTYGQHPLGQHAVAGDSWKFDVLVTFAEKATREALDFVWERDGADRAARPLPQTVPFRYYTKPAYDLPADQWWTGEADGTKLRAPVSSRVTPLGDLARFAWGLRWWGDHLQQGAWTRNADEVMSLVVSAPAHATAFNTSSGEWTESEGASDTAAIWALRYAVAFDSPHEDRIITFVKGEVARAGQGQATIEYRVLAREWSAAFPESSVALPQISMSSANSLELRALLANDLSHMVPTALAGRLLESILLRQAVWQPTTVTGTEVFGAIPEDHQLSVEQAEWAPDLLEAAVRIGDEALARRALAAVRAPLALFHHQTYGASGMWLPQTLGLNKTAEWFDGGSFGPEAPVAEGSGRILASLAWVLHRFGSIYTSEEGWTIGIDGLELAADGTACSAFSRNPLSFQSVFPYTSLDARTGAREDHSDPAPALAMHDLRLALDSEGVQVVAVPGFVARSSDQLSGSFNFDGERVGASLSAFGFSARPPIGWSGGRVRFQGAFKGALLDTRAAFLSIGVPPIDKSWPRGWRRMQGLALVQRPSLDRLSTADDGAGHRDNTLTGTIESASFLNQGTAIRVSVDTGGDLRVRLEVIDVRLGVPIATLASATGSQTIDLSEWKGSTLRIRLVDESRTGSIEAWDFLALGA